MPMNRTIAQLLKTDYDKDENSSGDGARRVRRPRTPCTIASREPITARPLTRAALLFAS